MFFSSWLFLNSVCKCWEFLHLCSSEKTACHFSPCSAPPWCWYQGKLPLQNKYLCFLFCRTGWEVLLHLKSLVGSSRGHWEEHAFLSVGQNVLSCKCLLIPIALRYDLTLLTELWRPVWKEEWSIKVSWGIKVMTVRETLVFVSRSWKAKIQHINIYNCSIRSSFSLLMRLVMPALPILHFLGRLTFILWPSFLTSLPGKCV